MRYSHAFAVIVSFGLVACQPGVQDTAADDGEAEADGGNDVFADVARAAPASVTDNATIMDYDGNVVQEGTNGFTCYPESATSGPVCNDATWGAMMAAMAAGEPFEPTAIGVSYMLGGEGDSPGVSNIDPSATEPTEDNDWIKEGPHMMLIVPDAASFDGLSTDPSDPVYVMWKGTPYQHIMIRTAEEE